MTLKELYTILEIDAPEDMAYFEQLAELLEMDEFVDENAFANVLSAVEAETAGDFAENYIKELTDALPETGGEDLAEYLSNMQQRLMLLAEDLDKDQARSDYTVELYKLRNWLHETAGALMDGRPCTLLEAFTELRAGKMGLSDHSFNFDNSPALVPEEMCYGLGSFDKIEL